MLRHLGYAALAISIDAPTSRTCRLQNVSPARLRRLIASNLDGLLRVLEFNVREGIFLYRISSGIVPFASHPINAIPWWDEFSAQLDELADFVKRHGMRVSMHPGQYTVLNSRQAHITAASLREVEWHVKFLDCLQADGSSKVVVHVGGGYGNKRLSLDRFVSVANCLPENVRRRLAVENDERVFTVEDVLDIAGRTHLPVVFDWLHHKTNPGRRANVTELLSECFNTWQSVHGLPKVHFSSQRQGGRAGEHADWINAAEFAAFLRITPRQAFDCMLEAKCKELALLRLRNALSDSGLGEGSAA